MQGLRTLIAYTVHKSVINPAACWAGGFIDKVGLGILRLGPGKTMKHQVKQAATDEIDGGRHKKRRPLVAGVGPEMRSLAGLCGGILMPPGTNVKSCLILLRGYSWSV